MVGGGEGPHTWSPVTGQIDTRPLPHPLVCPQRLSLTPQLRPVMLTRPLAAKSYTTSCLRHVSLQSLQIYVRILFVKINISRYLSLCLFENKMQLS